MAAKLGQPGSGVTAMVHRPEHAADAIEAAGRILDQIDQAVTPPAAPVDRDLLIADHVWLAQHIARNESRYVPPAWVSDMRSAALEGLTRAAAMYDPAKGFKFATYAGHRIRGAIADEKRRLLTGRNGRKNRAKNERSLEGLAERVSKWGDTQVTVDELACMVDRNSDPQQVAEPAQDVDAAWELVDRLDPKERSLAHLYYEEGLTMAELARRYGVTEARICQRLTKIKEHLAVLAVSRGLRSAA